jgi:hypothetical protein
MYRISGASLVLEWLKYNSRMFAAIKYTGQVSVESELKREKINAGREISCIQPFSKPRRKKSFILSKKRC